MVVEVSPLNILGGLAPITKFVDPLNSAAFFEANWIQGKTTFNPVASTMATEGASIGTLFDAQPGLFWSFDGNNNPNYVIHSWAYPMPAVAFAGKNQYVQCTKVRNNANGAAYVIDGGIGVLRNTNGQNNSSGNGLSGWNLYTITNAATAYTLRQDNGGNSVSDLGGFSGADGDIVRVEARILSPTAVEIKTFKNGTLQNTFTQNPSGTFGVAGGVPMLTGSILTGIAGASGSPQNQWRNFECGLL